MDFVQAVFYNEYNMEDGVYRCMQIKQQKEIGARMKKERKYRGLKLDDCARLLGISGPYLGLVERGDRMLSLDKAIRFCQVFGIPADYLLFGDVGWTMNPTDAQGNVIFELEGLEERDYFILLSMIKAYKISAAEKFPYRMRKS